MLGSLSFLKSLMAIDLSIRGCTSDVLGGLANLPGTVDSFACAITKRHLGLKCKAGLRIYEYSRSD
jgi:hypothetical protein